VITVEEVADLIRKERRGKLPEGLVLGPDSGLEEIGLSSLQVSEIVFTLEEEHEIEFDAAKAADVKTIGQLVALGNEAIGSDAVGAEAV
jgi:acyl carrier protein